MDQELNKVSTISVFYSGKPVAASVKLPASKSESNRALMLQAYSAGLISIENLSEAEDTKILSGLLSENGAVLDAGHGGTTFRFLCPWLAIYRPETILKGSARLHQRPVGPLIAALRNLGATIDYVENEGFPPLKFGKFSYSGQKVLRLTLQISSQFISALMMSAPNLPEGLELKFPVKTTPSLPYLSMTKIMMENCGLEVNISSDRIYIPHQSWKKHQLTIENDWSSASYFFAITALIPGSKLTLSGLRSKSLQGDAQILNILSIFGLIGTFSEQGLSIENKGVKKKSEKQYFHLKDTPDIAQTLIVLFLMLGQEAEFTGLETLAIKESNRLETMQQELKKVGACMIIRSSEGYCYLPGNQVLHPPDLSFETHNDHRVAMSVSLLSVQFPIKIQNPGVVAKSYPQYWSELQSIGFEIQNT